MAYAQSEMKTRLDPLTFALSQPRGAGDHRDRHRTTASQRKRQRGAHGVEVGFTE
jgi:hypothetical protein